jgi:hypothetical protein
MAFLTDTFTDTEGTTLASHSGEVGATWAKVTGITGNAEIASNRVRGTSSTTALYYASGTPATAEYDITAVIRRQSDLGTVRIYGRLSTTADTGYGVRFNGGATNVWELQLIQAGTTTSLGTWAETFSNGEDRTVILEIRDATKKVYIDGVERISSADNTVTSAGRVGMRFFAGSSPSDITAYHVASITAEDAGGTDATVIAVPMEGTASMPTPTVEAGGSSGTTIVAPVMTATASMPAMTLSLDMTVPMMEATASMPAPTVLVSQDATIVSPVMEATAQVSAPVVQTGSVGGRTRLSLLGVG